MNELGPIDEFESQVTRRGGELSKGTEIAIDLAAGSVSGGASIFVGQPFDTIKVRLQTQGHKYNHAMDCFHKTVKGEGYRALFKGMTPPLVTAAAVNAIVFASFGLTIRFIAKDQAEVSYGQMFLAGSCAGLVQVGVLCPTELIKCRLQAQTGREVYKGPMDCMKQIIRKDGVTGLFRGGMATVYREVPAYGVYFSLYEYLKTSMLSNGSSNYMASTVSGGLSGMMTWLLSYPMDVAKSVIQVGHGKTFKERSAWFVMHNIYKTKGIRYMFKGLSATLLRAVPVNAVIWPTYEMCVKGFTAGAMRYPYLRADPESA